ncbi:unnamed protein product [Rotaria sordida]|uniref:Uncharacterized protein n=1 Tax=Rotaria sordida TaxID=392033 RepID=A0A819MQV8_9BILA|nr:unnamed protein product [Rotaria sordida]CAF3983464.1 unnamed protein product [Rotaria sordida]
MTDHNQHHGPISTVQLSPFGEEQWNRIVTYSPIYVHWTDMLMMSQQRTHKPSSGKLNLMGHIDLNTLKLEDELLLNELHDIRKAAANPSKGKNTNNESKVVDDTQNHREAPSTIDDYQASSTNFSHDSREPAKHHSSYVESSFIEQQYKIKRPVLSNQTIPLQANGDNQVKKLSQISFGTKQPSSIITQLRQSAIIREQSFSTTNDNRISSPLSVSSSKRNIVSAHSNHNYCQQQKYQASKSSLSNDINTTGSIHEQLTRESSSSFKGVRARSTTSSRSTIRMLKTKNDRKRQKQNIELKTLLVDPYKQIPWNDGILDESIPNSLEIMHKTCGPGTPFERNLRYNYHRQLNLFRNGSMRSLKYS